MTTHSNFIETLVSFFQKPEEETNGQVPEGLCPNCWGTQEYDNQIRELYKDRQIDVNNHKDHYAFVQDFIVNHVNGIRLIKGNHGFTCPTCHTKYDE